jgi:hypothetical protein
MHWRRFRYLYRRASGEGSGDGQTVEVGSPEIPFCVDTALEGERIDGLEGGFPDVSRNIGIELDQVDLDDGDAMAWLRALIWPEHRDNRELFDAALKMAKKFPPDVRAGDALVHVLVVIGELADGEPVNVYHSHTLNQFSAESKAKLDEILADASIGRPVNRRGFEGSRSGFSSLTLTEYRDGLLVSSRELAECESHGRWIRWL